MGIEITSSERGMGRHEVQAIATVWQIETFFAICPHGRRRRPLLSVSFDSQSSFYSSSTVDDPRIMHTKWHRIYFEKIDQGNQIKRDYSVRLVALHSTYNLKRQEEEALKRTRIFCFD